MPSGSLYRIHRMSCVYWFYTLYLAVIHFITCGICEELSVSPIAQSLQVGQSGIFECAFTNSSYNSYLKWTLYDGTVLSSGDTSEDGRFTNEDGILKMINLTLADSGEYLCENLEIHNTVTGHLKVFIMPTYVLEGFIVIAINGVLLVLFIYSMIKTYREQNIKDSMHAF